MMQTKPILARVTLALAGLVGAAGVMAAAASSHGGGSANLGAITTVCLAHGPALLALGLSPLRGRLFGAAAISLALGTLIFAGDLLSREYLGHSAFPFAAPLGGAGMIGGWGLVIAGGLFSRVVIK